MAPPSSTIVAPARPTIIDREAAELVARLSPRERDVLQELVDGKAVDDGAASLFVSRHTFRTHVKNIMLKFASHSSLEVVCIAARAGVRPSTVSVDPLPSEPSEHPAIDAFVCLPVPLAELTVSGRISRINTSFEDLVGRTAQELHGATLDLLTPSEDVRRDIDLFSQACGADDIVGPLAKRFLRGDGRVVWCEVTMSAVRHHGVLEGVLLAATDVTSRLIPDAVPITAATRWS